MFVLGYTCHVCKRFQRPVFAEGENPPARILCPQCGTDYRWRATKEEEYGAFRHGFARVGLVFFPHQIARGVIDTGAIPWEYLQRLLRAAIEEEAKVQRAAYNTETVSDAACRDLGEMKVLARLGIAYAREAVSGAEWDGGEQ